jgi:hypothetical protein
MTKQEWKKRCLERIPRAVKRAGRIRMRDLKRTTHYDRGPKDGEDIGLSLEVWYAALEHLEKTKVIVLELDEEFGAPVWAMTPVVAEALRMAGVSPVKRVSPVGSNI